MGCMTDREHRPAADAESHKQKKGEPAKSAAAPAPLKKLTPEE